MARLLSLATCCAVVLGVVAETAQWRVKLLDDHNKARRSVGGANIAALVWDNALECVAKKYLEGMDSRSNAHMPNARRGAMYVECGGRDTMVGENWFSDRPENAVRLWVDFEWPKSWGFNGCSERQNFAAQNTALNVAATNPTGGTTSQCRGGVTGHFTQVVWANTRRLGCYYVKGRGTLCNYWPAGNVYGQSYAKTGASCTACPTDIPMCQAGLCVTGTAQTAAQPKAAVPTTTTAAASTTTCKYSSWTAWAPCGVDCGPEYVTRRKRSNPYRDDLRCGPGFAAPNGDGWAICNPGSTTAFCCSEDGHCGATTRHCSCQGCKNYKKTGSEIRWRTDYRCGPKFPDPSGRTPSQCNPDDPLRHCCSSEGVCGGTAGHCARQGAVDYLRCPEIKEFRLRNSTAII